MAASHENKSPVWMVLLDLNLKIKSSNQRANDLLSIRGPLIRGSSILDCVDEVSSQKILEMQQNPQANLSRAIYLELNQTEDKSQPNLAYFFLDGDGYCFTGISLNNFIDSLTSPDELFFKHHSCSPREKEVIQMVIRGHAIPEISKKLGVKVNTVKSYLHGIYMKVGVQSRREFFEVLKSYHSQIISSNSYLGALLSFLR